MPKRKGPLGGHFISFKRHSDGRTSDQILLPSTSSGSVEAILQPGYCEQLPLESSSVPAYDDEPSVKEKTAQRWEDLRCDVMDCLMTAAAPACDSCSVCQKLDINVVRCLSCGPNYYVCEDCACLDHRIRPYHQLEIWKVSAHRKCVLICPVSLFRILK